MKRQLAFWLCAMGVLMGLAERASATQPVVPGSGQRVDLACDDFEDPDWAYSPKLPKSSQNIDEQVRSPLGWSSNRRMYENSYRGSPDHLRRVDTPAGGIEGSQGSLLIMTLNSGIPGRNTRDTQQDVIMMNVRSAVGGWLSPSTTPQAVVRVYLPPMDQWEQRSGATFALRCDVEGNRGRTEGGLFSARGPQIEEYWPGIFIAHTVGRGGQPGTAHFIIRSDERGRDYKGPDIKQLGWWTLGMSITPDGYVHYYASPGVDDLTADDHLASHRPYGFVCQKFESYYFDVFNLNDGRTWSTPWIIDDPQLFVSRLPQTAAGSRSRR